MKKKSTFQKIVFCLIISFFLSRNCVTDDYCDPDPLYGGCSNICNYEDVTLTDIGFKTLGLYIFASIFQELDKL